MRTLKTILLILTPILLWPVHNAVAVPASPEQREVVQPDGTRVHVKLRGDEFFSWTETTNGYAVKKDSDGFWKYARPSSNRADFIVIPDARVGSTDPATRALKKHALPDRGVLRKQIQDRRRMMRGDPVDLTVPAAAPGGASPASSVAAPAEDLPSEPPLPPPAQIPVSGTKTIKNIVLLACFSDHWDSGAGTVLSTKGRVSVGEYSNLFNEVNHTNDSAVGSVRDYYKEVSYGKLTISSVISMWVKLPQNEAYYGADGGNHDTNWKAMITDAITAADTAGFDFSQGDSDSDGWVDGLTVIHSGHGQEQNGNPSNCIWSKQGEISPVVTKDDVKMKRCHTEPALRGLTTSNSIIRIGVICHEMGHFFGLPDLYDYSNTTDGIGDWGIMSGGSWNGTDGKRPAHFCAWSKCMLGFANPVPIHSQNGVSLASVESNAAVRILRDGTSNGEYFLIENRAKAGFDNDPYIFPGILIYHVDSKSVDNDLDTWPHPVVKIEEADGDDSLGTKTVPSEAGDVWTGTSGLAGGFRDQTGNQSANAMRYQSADYNRTDSATYYTCNLMSNFSAAGSTMTFDAATLKTPVGSQTGVVSSAYTVSWAAASQAAKYEIQAGSRATLTNFADGAEDEDAMYENWYMAGSVRRSSAGQQAGSYSYLLQRYDSISENYYSSMQSLTMQKPFKVKTGTVLSFYQMSQLYAGSGYLKCQISSDSGDTWKTLGTYDGITGSWTLRSYNYTAMNAQGISADDMCIVRFVANFEYTYGFPAFPGYGFALDTITINGTEIDGYGGWTTLNSNVTATSYAITGKTNGVYAYRVRAYANSIWQGYGPEGEITVNLAQDDLRITPAEGVAFSGTAGGITDPANQVYVLTNAGGSALSWSAARTSSWVNLSATNGTLAAGAATNVTVSVNSGALAEGNFFDTVIFTNTTRGISNMTRQVSLNVTPPYVYFFPLNTNPGWTVTGQWEFGHPTGQGGSIGFQTTGSNDPSSGATGTNVFGVNLNGNYTTSNSTAYYLTAGPFNFSGYTNVVMHFQRWLNTDKPQRVTATIEVSSNSTTWTTVYTNSAAITNTSWSRQTNNISTTADRQTNVYVRWGYSTIGLDSAYASSGWNVDDIGFLGTAISSTYTVTFDAQGGTAASPLSMTVTNGATYGTLAATTRTGYTFAGWWTGAGGSGTEVTSSATVTLAAAQTLYANWTANTYTVTFDAQGGTAASPASTNVTYGSTYGTLAATARTGYTFAGWWTGAGGSGTEVTSSTTVTITGAQTLYANWTASVTSQGTPCPWLDQYGLVTGGDYEAAALADTDGDGFAAWQEYIAGSNPTNQQSFFGISSVNTSTNSVVIQWAPGTTGRVYGVHWTTNLLNGFQPLETNIVWPQASYTDTAHSAEIRSFYRVKVQLAP